MGLEGPTRLHELRATALSLGSCQTLGWAGRTFSTSSWFLRYRACFSSIHFMSLRTEWRWRAQYTAGSNHKSHTQITVLQDRGLDRRTQHPGSEPPLFLHLLGGEYVWGAPHPGRDPTHALWGHAHLALLCQRPLQVLDPCLRPLHISLELLAGLWAGGGDIKFSLRARMHPYDGDSASEETLRRRTVRLRRRGCWWLYKDALWEGQTPGLIRST